MAVGWFSRCSASLVLVLLFATSLNIPSVPERLFDDGDLFLALNLNSASFPGLNSGLPRRSTSVASSPSWKLQASSYLANVSLSARIPQALNEQLLKISATVNLLSKICKI